MSFKRCFTYNFFFLNDCRLILCYLELSFYNIINLDVRNHSDGYLAKKTAIDKCQNRIVN